MKSESTYKLKSVFFFIVCFGFGLAIFFSVAEDFSVQRDPAALHGKVFQFNNFDHDQLKAEIEKKIKISPVGLDQKAIAFQGFSSNLCRIYKEVHLEFFAEGISVGGEPTTMTIQAPCTPAQDPADMASIIIPVEKITSQTPKDAEFQFTGWNAKFVFKRAADEWPKIWVLKSVEFKSETGKSKLVQFNHRADHHPIVLEF